MHHSLSKAHHQALTFLFFYERCYQNCFLQQYCQQMMTSSGFSVYMRGTTLMLKEKIAAQLNLIISTIYTQNLFQSIQYNVENNYSYWTKRISIVMAALVNHAFNHYLWAPMAGAVMTSFNSKAVTKWWSPTVASSSQNHFHLMINNVPSVHFNWSEK